MPVRLDPDEKRRLRAAAAAMGMTPSALIRLLVRSFVEEYERSGGRIALPPRWETATPGGQERVAEDAADPDAPLPRVAETHARYPVAGKRKRPAP